MDINAFKNPYTGSLLDYIGNQKTSYFDSVAQNLLQTYGSQKTAQNQSVNQGDSVTLSEEAQALLSAGSSGTAALSGIQQGAANLMMSFFDQGNIDLADLSPEMLDILDGLHAVIGGAGATARDMATDGAEMRYAGGSKQVYTLVGDGQRLRVAVDYQDGVPTKLSLTDIVGGQVETAEITLVDDNGTPSVNIDRTQKEYRNGYMVTTAETEPLLVRLYAQTASA